MLKKILLIAGLVLFAGVLVVGAVNRTVDKSAQAAEVNAVTAVRSQQGNGATTHANESIHEPSGSADEAAQGPQNHQFGSAPAQTDDENEGAPLGRAGQGGPPIEAAGQGSGTRLNLANPESHEWVTVEGEVLQAPAAGIDMLLQTADGALTVGTGPDYLGQQGYILGVGDQVQVTGFWEAGEFKVAEIVRLADGAAITLRDEMGRPFWSGALQNGRGGGRGQGQGQGQGNFGQGQTN